MQAEDRLHTADYVEARGVLLPATEYLKRAVDSAQVQGILTGQLLATVRHNLHVVSGWEDINVYCRLQRHS